MTIKLTSTKIVDPSKLLIKVAVFGEAGIGKTVLCGTAPRPIIISAEKGLLSLASKDIPVIEVTSKAEVDEAYQYLLSPEAQALYDTVCLDSVSEIAEKLLHELKKTIADGRQYYTQLADDVSDMIRSFRDFLPYHVIFTVKQTRFTDDYTGVTKFRPDMPGNNLKNGIPYFFDELFAMRVADLSDGSGTYRYLQPQPDITFEAKDRSGALGGKHNKERPDMSFIFDKIKKHIANNPDAMNESTQNSIQEQGNAPSDEFNVNEKSKETEKETEKETVD